MIVVVVIAVVVVVVTVVTRRCNARTVENVVMAYAHDALMPPLYAHFSPPI